MSDLKVSINQEKKEVKAMKKVGMDKLNKDILLEIITEEKIGLHVPKKVTVRKINTGQIERKDKEPLLWASVEVSDSEELQKLTEMGYEDNVGVIKLKIANYMNESLEYLVGKELDTEGLEVVFDEKKTPRGTELKGLAFRTELNQVKVVG